MADNFIDTAERMRDSSRLLHSNSHYHNACYTAGYVVESYLKIFLNFGLPNSSASARSYRHDITTLGRDLAYAASAATASSRYRNYILDVSVDCSCITNHWNPNKRYEEGRLSWNAQMSQNFQIEMEKCFDMITRMTIDSII